MSKTSAGFTLIEILIVLAIIGIFAGIFGLGLIRSIRGAELREAASQVATDFRRARSQAQRGSADVTIEWTQTGADNTATTYTVNGVSRSLPSGVKLSCTSGCTGPGKKTVTYTAPYGEIGTSGSVLTLKSSASSMGITDLEVRVVGVTGKVILMKAGS